MYCVYYVDLLYFKSNIGAYVNKPELETERGSESVTSQRSKPSMSVMSIIVLWVLIIMLVLFYSWD